MSPALVARRAAMSALLLAAGAGAACTPTVHAPIDVESIVAHEPGSGITIETINGAVELVIDPSRTDVHVRMSGRVAAATLEEATRRAGDSTVETKRDATGQLVVRPALAEPKRGEDEASLIVTAPSAAAATLRTTNGTVVAADITGDVDARSTNGRITLSSIGGSARAKTTNGSVTLDAIGGEAEARTTNGNVVVADAAGTIKASTTNGAVTLARVASSVDVSTTNGNVRIGLLGGFVGELDLGVSNGRVSVTRGDQSLASMRNTSGVITIAPGGTMSRVRTSNGTVTVTVDGADAG